MIKKVVLTLLLGISIASFSQGKTVLNLTTAPNPFVEVTNISFYSAVETPVLLSVRNILGKIVYKQNVTAKPGTNRIPFHRNELASGMYLYSLQTNKNTISKRFVIQ
jgi:hypothetical protein